MVKNRKAANNPTKNSLIWGDMNTSQRNRYVNEITGTVPNDVDPAYYGGNDDERPHGYEKKMDWLSVSDEGIEPFPDAMARLSSLGFSIENHMVSSGVGAFHKTGHYDRDLINEWAAYIITNDSTALNTERRRNSSKHILFLDGWSSSYHDANWNGLAAIVGIGDTPEEANRYCEELARSVIPGEDPVARRFKLRYLVRSGD